MEYLRVIGNVIAKSSKYYPPQREKSFCGGYTM